MAHRKPNDLLPVTPLHFQLLLALADEPRHGYGMLKEIEQQTGGRMKPATGTLYLALQRMDELDLVENARRPSSEDKRRRYYRITEFGREVAVAEADRMLAVVGAAIAKNIVRSAALRELVAESK